MEPTDDPDIQVAPKRCRCRKSRGDGPETSREDTAALCVACIIVVIALFLVAWAVVTRTSGSSNNNTTVTPATAVAFIDARPFLSASGLHVLPLKAFEHVGPTCALINNGTTCLARSQSGDAKCLWEECTPGLSYAYHRDDSDSESIHWAVPVSFEQGPAVWQMIQLAAPLSIGTVRLQTLIALLVNANKDADPAPLRADVVLTAENVLRGDSFQVPGGRMVGALLGSVWNWQYNLDLPGRRVNIQERLHRQFLLDYDPTRLGSTAPLWFNPACFPQIPWLARHHQGGLSVGRLLDALTRLAGQDFYNNTSRLFRWATGACDEQGLAHAYCTLYSEYYYNLDGLTRTFLKPSPWEELVALLQGWSDRLPSCVVLPRLQPLPPPTVILDTAYTRVLDGECSDPTFRAMPLLQMQYWSLGILYAWRKCLDLFDFSDPQNRVQAWWLICQQTCGANLYAGCMVTSLLYGHGGNQTLVAHLDTILTTYGNRTHPSCFGVMPYQ